MALASYVLSQVTRKEYSLYNALETQKKYFYTFADKLVKGSQEDNNLAAMKGLKVFKFLCTPLD